MHNGQRVSVVIPCYNEEKGLKKMFANVPEIIDELLVVDNDSTDETANVASGFGANVIKIKKRQYGFSYQLGLPKASGDILVTLDGDASYPMSEIPRLLAYLTKGNYDFVIASRFPLSSKKAMPIHKRYANYFITSLIRNLFSLNITDTQSGMMVFKKSILPAILSSHSGMGFSQEMKLHAVLNKRISCSELKIAYAERIGPVKFRRFKDSMDNLMSVLRYFFAFKILNKPGILLLKRYG